MKRFASIVLIMFLVAVFAPCGRAQFKKDAFSQSYNNDDPKAQKDSVEKLFSFEEYFGGLKHEREARIGTLFGGSAVFVGGQQIYNRDYWKLPLVYGSILGSAGAGVYFNRTGRNDIAKYCFAGAGLAYWATLMDGVINYKPDPYPHAGKATLYSILLPGLGQAYNGEWWKIPIYDGGLMACLYYYRFNTLNYNRFRRIYIEASAGSSYTGPISAETALYYRNIYRTYRDYSIVATLLVYLIQVIDANVFAYMHDFEVNDDLSFNISPTLIPAGVQICSQSSFDSISPLTAPASFSAHSAGQCSGEQGVRTNGQAFSSAAGSLYGPGALSAAGVPSGLAAGMPSGLAPAAAMPSAFGLRVEFNF